MTRIRVTRPARKHQIGNAHILEAMRNAGEPTRDGDALTYVGLDSRGVEIEVVAVPDDRNPDGLSVIHAMPTEWRNR